MLLLSIFLVSCCLPGSMGAATQEFQHNLKTLLAQVNKETFVEVPDGKFECSHVPCQLNKTITWLKNHFGDNERRNISRLEKNMDHIISALNTGQTRAQSSSSCETTELRRPKVQSRFGRYFRKLHENCPKP